ncbi:hypothetical protein, unknown function [Leishmania donovani]|uniref:Uncharacterized protein n=1 Tax=Leishmania donovani TaxID=5661 RepID=A0A3S7WRC5_LEIDO|nr:hypothetical protein, unknown function [Leishmania donovani]AYU76738.1 hypothetical protein LdCL_100018400 [Leishmania donovani]TPP46561.1 hypothetical protein CGC21_23340 [Leishmania donovani]CBZ32232.1 hypothetical protein, unknown function [Leishmania donovani]
MWHVPPHKSAHDSISSSVAASSSAVAPSALSEDLARLLAWGRHALLAQRQQRRASSTSLACADQDSMSPRPPRLSSSAAPVSTPVAPGTDERSWELHAQGLKASASTSDFSRTTADAPYTVEQARKRLAQLEELEAANTRVFESRWALLSLGRERLLRLHRKQREGEAPSPHTRHLQRLTVAVQAIVEGEASLKEALRDMLRGLAELYQRHQLHHGQTEEYAAHSASAREKKATLLESVHGGGSCDSEEDAGAKESAPDSLRSLADAVVRRTRLLLDSHCELQRARAEQRRAATARLQRRAESEQALQHRLERLKAAVAEATKEEAHERRRLAELRAQCAAAERAAALQNASALREQATKEALQRLQQLHQHAAFQDAIARQELAASEARYHEAKAAYDMAISDHHAAEEALAAAQQAYRDSKRRREDAEDDLERVRQALKSVSDKYDEVHAQRAQAAADCAAVDEALYQKRRARDGRLSGEKGDDSSEVAAAFCLGGSSAANGAAERYTVLQRELPRLERHLQRSVEEVVALERTEAELRGTLERERSALDLLRRQKTALEAHLASLESCVDGALGVVAREKAGSQGPAVW